MKQEVEFMEQLKKAWTAAEVHWLTNKIGLFMSDGEGKIHCIAAAQAKLEALGEDRAEVGSRGGKPAAEMEV
jgi:hypothetical protein